MNEEGQAFARRLAQAMRDNGYEPRPSVLVAHFNSRWRGQSVAFQSASRWLGGKSIPDQPKLQLIADLYGVKPHVLRFGEADAVNEARESWGVRLSPEDRRMVAEFAALPAAQRRLVRELVQALAAKG